MTIKEPVSLSMMAKTLGINKSKLAYYAKIGLITPAATLGKTFIYDKDPLVKRLKEIERIRKQEQIPLEELAKRKQV